MIEPPEVLLTLVPVTPELNVAWSRSRDSFAALIGTPLPEGWPAFPEAFRTTGPSEPAPWCNYLLMAGIYRSLLVGNGGFKAPPDERGEVEIGYEIAPGLQNRGFATEAARRLVRLAFANGAKAVVAHTLAATNASNAVLGKAGMRLIDVVPHARLGAVWRYRIAAPG